MAEKMLCGIVYNVEFSNVTVLIFKLNDKSANSVSFSNKAFEILHPAYQIEKIDCLRSKGTQLIVSCDADTKIEGSKCVHNRVVLKIKNKEKNINHS
jgi:bifunctional ADP-heptose synthase (sugar kinase/adenylyltransferase)